MTSHNLALTMLSSTQCVIHLRSLVVKVFTISQRSVLTYYWAVFPVILLSIWWTILVVNRLKRNLRAVSNQMFSLILIIFFLFEFAFWGLKLSIYFVRDGKQSYLIIAFRKSAMWINLRFLRAFLINVLNLKSGKSTWRI